MQLETVEAVFSSRPAEAKAHLIRAREIVRRSLEETRRAIKALRPGPLERASLPEALREMGESILVGTPIRLVLETTGHPQALPNEQENDLWHIGQEALSNAVRHSKCQSVLIALLYEKDLMRMAISDDGEGFAVSPFEAYEGFGLRGMKERARMWGWHLSVHSVPGAGTEVSVEVPIKHKDAAKRQAPDSARQGE